MMCGLKIPANSDDDRRAYPGRTPGPGGAFLSCALMSAGAARKGLGGAQRGRGIGDPGEADRTLGPVPSENRKPLTATSASSFL